VSLEIINNFSSAEAQIANQFFQQYYLSILQDTFFVLTDADHKSGFKLQSLLLARMVQLVATDTIHAPLYDPAVVNDPNMTNAKFVRDYTANLLKSAFPHAARYADTFFLLARAILTFSRRLVPTLWSSC
jgi:exportin-1